MLIFPYGTDAPTYHRPFITAGLVLSNCIVFALQLMFPEISQGFILHFGMLNPLQWLTSFFMHANVAHLVGNMLFLWVFGLIVEGKIGWKMFSVVYLSVGLTSSMLLQVMNLGAASGGALGASAAIFGLLAIALIWAPVNEINFKACGRGFYYVFAFDFAVSVSSVAFFFLASNFFWAYMEGFAMSSQLAHLIGALVGGVVGHQMLRRQLVNCEGYDLVAMYQGKLGEKPAPTPAAIEAKNKRNEERKTEFQYELEKFKGYVTSGHIEFAYLKLTHLKRMNNRFSVDRETGGKMVKELVAKNKIKPAVELLEEMIDRCPNRPSALLINLALIYLQHLDRPRKAIETLNRLAVDKLTPKQHQIKERIRHAAFNQIKKGCIEVGD